MQTLVEDFLQYLRHERGQSGNTAKTYAALLGKFTAWAEKENLTDWKSVGLQHLMAFLQHERARPLVDEPKGSIKRLSSESVYLEIAALRAFYRYAENEKLLPANVAENLSLPRRWQRLPKALSNEEISKLLAPENSETPESLCDQAILELAYASGLRLSELKNLRLEQLHLDAGFINVIGKGNKERVVPVGRTAVAALNRFIEAGRPKLVTPKSPATVFLTKRGTPAMVKGVFDELLKDAPKNHFTIGINDDVSHSSLSYDPDFSTEDPKTVRALFYGLGSDGTVGANKNSIKIIGSEPPILRRATSCTTRRSPGR